MKLFKPVSVTHSATLFNIPVIMWIFDFYLGAGWIMKLFDYRHLSAFIVASIQEPNWGYEMILFEQGSAHIPMWTGHGISRDDGWPCKRSFAIQNDAALAAIRIDCHYSLLFHMLKHFAHSKRCSICCYNYLMLLLFNSSNFCLFSPMLMLLDYTEDTGS